MIVEKVCNPLVTERESVSDSGESL
jgi:hypothetical protein